MRFLLLILILLGTVSCAPALVFFSTQGGIVVWGEYHSVDLTPTNNGSQK